MHRFEDYAALRPRFYLLDAAFVEKRADVQPFPEQTMDKPFLKRIVQLLKRHRDHAFVTPSRNDLAPISIVLTTLAAWSYAYCVTRNTYSDAFELITDVIRRLPDFIKIEERNGQRHYVIENETTAGENFADKWNQNSQLAVAFFAWHKNVLASVETMLDLEGADQVGKHLQESYGATPDQVKRAFAPITSAIGASRAAGSLIVAPSLGIATAPAFGSVSVRQNTFFGR